MDQRISLETTDDISKVKYIEVIIIVLTLLLAIITRVQDKSLITFSFLFEVFVLVMIFRSHYRSIIHRNFSYWGMNFLIFLYLLRIILHHTFVEYNVMVLYLAFLDVTALAINSYIMSSPIFYPRVQWWEYDFRYRGDLKAKVEIDNSEFKSRLIDLRREACCVELFENVKLESPIKVSVNYEGKVYSLEGAVRTIHQDIPGRQIRYGVKLNTIDPVLKQSYYELKKKWHNRKKVKLRNKFKEIQNGIDV